VSRTALIGMYPLSFVNFLSQAIRAAEVKRNLTSILLEVTDEIFGESCFLTT